MGSTGCHGLALPAVGGVSLASGLEAALPAALCWTPSVIAGTRREKLFAGVQPMGPSRRTYQSTGGRHART